MTYETYQTFRGHRPQNTVVYRESNNDQITTTSHRGNGAGVPDDTLTDSACTTDLSASVRSLTVTPRGATTSTSPSNSGSISNLLKPPVSGGRSNSCSPFAAKKGLNGALSTSSLASRSVVPMPTSSSVATFAADCSRAHNEYRRKHGVPDLKLSPKLCQYAQEWADTLSRRGVLQSRGGTRFGENIFCVQSSSPIEVNGCDPVDNWYNNEAKLHVYGREPNTLKTGHFTQIVWRETQELGVAVSRNRNGQIFVVANYDPPGNVIGTYSENVPPIGGFLQQEQEPKVSSTTNTTATDLRRTVPASHRQRDYVASKLPQNLSFSESVCDTDDTEAFARAILKHHNEYRRRHNVPELVLDTILNGVAQSWASNLGKSDKFGHNPSTKYGENVYCMWSSDRNANPNPKDVCRSWYDEIRDFSFGTEARGRTATTGHFTQIVWRNSKKLGVGLSKTRTGKVVVVCNYDPSGNIAGQYNANVPRPTSA